MPYDAVLLDLYDTIVWSRWFQLGDRIAERAGLDQKALLEAFDLTRPARGVGAYPDAAGDMAAVIQAAGLDADPSLVRDLVALEREHLATDVEIYDDVSPVLRSLRERGARTALVSNCSHGTRDVVDRLELASMFDAVLLSFEVGAMKPDPAIYQAALAAVGDIEPARAVFVDDQPRYCDGASAIGLSTRLILRPDDRSFETLEAGDDPPAVDTHGHEVVTDLRWLG